MKVKSLLICAVLASPSVHALEFTTNATEEDYQMAGMYLTLLDTYANNPMFCKSYPTPNTNKALKELRSLKSSMNPWYETEFNQGVAAGMAAIEHEKTLINGSMTRAQCNASDKSTGDGWSKIVAAWKRVYFVR
ncbi:hypothetical protein ACNUDM_22105 [Vibrio chaetopteri]|uniref:hypothetical protein n=1 Tax=Vibrio chaetopteri TaxID=3016528 RepID=UPI003AB15B46